MQLCAISAVAFMLQVIITHGLAYTARLAICKAWQSDLYAATASSIQLIWLYSPWENGRIQVQH